ncbi:hypothetical protein KSP39_PZI022250 [Platanthera zijinensis]|uniref:C2HC zinc finger plants domain-containing protein n=1 Tax=Platanthera zijinensis TaxID=2320716 RepID=A0AAP0AVZ2_9ASPA
MHRSSSRIHKLGEFVAENNCDLKNNQELAMESMNTDEDIVARNEPGVAAPFLEATPAGRATQRFPTVTGRENMWSLLALARHLVTQGKPSLALQAVVMAMRSEGGEQAVLSTLNRAQELYINRLQANSAVDDLSSLFAECALAEARPLNPVATPPPEQPEAVNPVSLAGVSEESILAKSGRMQIMVDAFSDGSSFICLKCGGLVSNHRKDEHFMYWCS